MVQNRGHETTPTITPSDWEPALTLPFPADADSALLFKARY
jgi:hypothetical protein